MKRRKGSALVLTLFTVAALLTLGTTFIVLATNESRMSGSEKDAQQARQMANVGINWAISYMGHPTHWGGPSLDLSTASYYYPLKDGSGGDISAGSGEDVSWMGKTARMAAVDNVTWTMDVVTPFYIGPQAQAITKGRVFVTVRHLVPNSGDLAYLRSQPPQYTIEAVARLYKVADATYSSPVAGSTMTARVRTETAADYAVFESNTRSWDTPGFNLQYRPTTASIQDDYDATVGMVRDTIGVLPGYQMNGDFRADGSSGTSCDGESGSIKVFTSDSTKLKTIKFTGSSGMQTGKTNTYGDFDSSGKFVPATSMTDTQAGVFSQGMSPGETKGLPNVAGFLDTRNDSGTLIDGNAAILSGRNQVRNGTPAPDEGVWGHIKVSTPTTGPVDVSTLTGANGADVEYQPGSKTPGFAKTQITFNDDGTVSVQKVGAYSGKPVPDANTGLVGKTVDVDKIANGIIYVDGGNVEVKGKVDGRVTVIAAASSDRPPEPIKNPSTGKWELRVTGSELSSNIYRPYEDFPQVSDSSTPSGKNIQIPMVDGSGKAWFPAWTPDSAAAYGKLLADKGITNPNDPAYAANAQRITQYQRDYMTRATAIEREGNMSITGDLTKKSGTASSLGLISQNYLLLSDQDASKPQSGATLKVDAVLMSMQHSVQYGGFLSEGDNYYTNMAGKNMPRPKQQFTNGKFQLTGSIIGAYADVESSAQGHGYTNQEFKQDATLKDGLPPCFPQFDRAGPNKRAVLAFVVLAWDDSSAQKAGH